MNHTIFTYSPSDFSCMEDPSKAAMLDRYNGIFTPLEISAEAFKAYRKQP